jgi:DNA repair protein RadC
MQHARPEIDIVNEVLEDCILAYPVSSFIISLYKQYQQRGSLSKKQLQGLHSKATDAKTISPAKLATLQALINKMPTRYKSEMPDNKPLYEKDEETGKMIEAILSKYPEHKRVLFLKSKYENNETLNTTDVADLKRFSKNL